MKIGDILYHVPSTDSSFGFKYEARENLLPCRVVWIHPEGRYYTVEFTLERGQRLRESYFPKREKEYIRRKRS